MNDAHAQFLQQRKLFVAGPNHVRGNDAIVEKAEAVQIIDRAGAFVFDAVIDFAFGFGNMNDDRRAGAIRELAHSFQMIL